MVKELEPSPIRNGEKNLQMFSLQKGRLKEDMIAAFTYLNGICILKDLDILPCSRR